MLTLKEKNRLGTSGEWIALVSSAVAQVAVDVKRENPADLSFGTFDASLDALPALRPTLQFEAHKKRAALATQTLSTRDALNKSAQTWAMALAANMCERIEEQSAGQGEGYSQLLRLFLSGAELPPEHQATIDATLVAVVRESVSAIAGFNAAYEVPAAIAQQTP